MPCRLGHLPAPARFSYHRRTCSQCYGECAYHAAVVQLMRVALTMSTAKVDLSRTRSGLDRCHVKPVGILRRFTAIEL